MKRVKNLVVGCGLTGMVLAERLASETWRIMRCWICC